MIAIAHLKIELDRFLDLHWGEKCKKHSTPTWSTLWKGVGELPNRLLPGCYALKMSSGVEYIGSGIRRGKYWYPDNGIGGRVSCYYSWDKSIQRADGKRVYKPNKDLLGVYTVGFPSEYGYMAIALEHYLIATLQPTQNTIRIASTK